jgi:hypothetical protein
MLRKTGRCAADLEFLMNSRYLAFLFLEPRLPGRFYFDRTYNLFPDHYIAYCWRKVCVLQINQRISLRLTRRVPRMFGKRLYFQDRPALDGVAALSCFGLGAAK